MAQNQTSTGARRGLFEADQIVVHRVFETCHLLIAEAVMGSAVPEEFLGALTANESGGRRDASCFEPAVYGRLKAVAIGQSACYGSLTWPEISAALNSNVAAFGPQLRQPLAIPETVQEAPRALSDAQDHTLRRFATSWGFTQIMGYHVIRKAATIEILLDAHLHFRLAVEILNDFAKGFHLLPRRDFAPLFRCWNTGRPDGKTFDPEYVLKGMRRLELYKLLLLPAGDKRTVPANARGRQL
ncbi:MAG: hypothetical protein ACRD3D_11040 [Terriglobia bacterium]